jgi:cytochrome c peroxidase
MSFRIIKTAVAVLLAGSCPTMAAPLNEPIRPLPATVSQDPRRVEIGRELFHDVRLSANNQLSCTSCHDLKNGGADHRARSLGFGGKEIGINTPTVFNAALNFKQFWNGRVDSLEMQIDYSVRSSVIFNSTWPDVIAKLSQDTHYQSSFAAVYENGITAATIQNAIASFERTLITPNARFDRYLRGDATALSDAEKVGYAKFKQYGCIACHQGVNVGGNMFQKLGVMEDYFAKRTRLTNADIGRYLATQEESDKYFFKVPSLRNVALTAPYFHDASAKTLEEAVDVMAKYQLGRVISSEDKQAIVQFLNTLTGELAGKP